MLTTSLILLIFRLVLDCILQQKTQSTKSVWKGRNVFSKRIWMKQAAYHFRRDYDLHAATSNSLFVISRQIVALRRKKYCRHNNLMTGVLWRTLRIKITSRIFWFCKKDILVGGISLFEGSRVDIYFQWSFVTLQLNLQRGVKNIASSSLEKKNN